MMENPGKWPSIRGPISKIRPSDGCGRNHVPGAHMTKPDDPHYGEDTLYDHIRPHQALNMRSTVPETLLENGT